MISADKCLAPRLPRTADIHVHLRGTMSPVAAKLLADRNRMKLPDSHLIGACGYAWEDFDEFLNIYALAGQVVREAKDLEFLAERYLASCAAEGTIYVEFMLSPTHLLQNGMQYPDQVAAVAAAIEAAREAYDIEARLIVTCVRQRGPADALKLAELVEANPHPLVVGFGLTGNERLFDTADFEVAFSIAQALGLGLTAHAGEWLDGNSVLRAVDALNLSRIGHGVRAAEDSAVLSELIARGIGFEVCLSSNVGLGLYSTFKHHPLKLMLDAGAKVSLATDDPAYFRTSPLKEYEIANAEIGISVEQLKRITLNSIEMSFCDPATKERLSARI